MSIVLVPGSFDPMTLGHVNVVERAAAIFDQVVVAIMINDQKQYRFSLAQRETLAACSCAHLPNVRVITDDGMLIDLVDKIGADAIIKGVRTVEDFQYEQKMAYWNREHNEKAETLYLPCDPRFSDLSSTRVRQCLETSSPLDGLLTRPAIEKLVEWGMI